MKTGPASQEFSSLIALPEMLITVSTVMGRRQGGDLVRVPRTSAARVP